MPLLPLWAQILMYVLPLIPQEAGAIASIFAPHAGTPTGTKIAATLQALAPLAAGAAQFDQAHQAQVAAAPTPKPA